jgi:hypothetical protein
MSNVAYKGSTNLRLTLNAGQVLTGATLYIKYIRPNNIAGSWTATIYPTSNLKLYKDLSLASDLSMNGKWRVWSYVIFAGGKIGIGTAKILVVKEEGEI